ncbi:MAG: hypothetical protein IID45_03250 [Planctomycetes bacterium]|nr:hypothetical protein [Planctomycetota bacterium]
MGLLDEPAITTQSRERLIENGATEAEADFIKGGRRVELNAMTNDRLITWLERKLAEAGIKKVIPDGVSMAQAARQILAERRLQKVIDEARPQVLDECKSLHLPEDLRQKVLAVCETEPALPWDVALAQIL